MSGSAIRKFIIFFFVYLVGVMFIQVYVFTSEEPVEALWLKNIVSGLIASAIFVFLTRKKGGKKA